MSTENTREKQLKLIFSQNEEYDILYVTSDNQCFTQEHHALNHAGFLDTKTVDLVRRKDFVSENKAEDNQNQVSEQKTTKGKKQAEDNQKQVSKQKTTKGKKQAEDNQKQVSKQKTTKGKKQEGDNQEAGKNEEVSINSKEKDNGKV